MKQGMKKILSVVCAVVLLFTSIGIDVLFTNNSQSEVQAADGYEKIGFTNFGITKETVYTNTSYMQIGPVSTRSLNEVEFEGIVNVTGRVRLHLGGTSRMDSVFLDFYEEGAITVGYCVDGADKIEDSRQYINHDENKTTDVDARNNDVIVNIKVMTTAVSDTTSSVTYEVTLTDAKDPTKTYTTPSFTYSGAETSELVQGLHIYTSSTSSITLKPIVDTVEYTKVDYVDFGVYKETEIKQTPNTGVTYVKSDETLHGMEIEDTVNVASGTTGYTILTYGASYGNGICLTWNKSNNYMMFSYKNEGIDDPKGYLNLSGGLQAGFDLFNNDLLVNVKFELATPGADTSDATVIVTLTDADDTTKSFTGTYNFEALPTQYLKQHFNVFNNDSKVTLKPQMTVLSVRDFNVPIGTAGGNATLDGTLDHVMIKGILNVPVNTSKVIYFGDLLGFEIGADGTIWVRTISGTDNGYANTNSYGSINYSSYMGKDTLWELSFWYTPGATDGKVYLNVAISFDGKYITTKTTPKEETIEHITREISIPSGIDVMWPDFGTLNMADFGIAPNSAGGSGTLEGDLDNVTITGTFNVPADTAKVIYFGDLLCFEIGADGTTWVRTVDGTDNGYANTNSYGSINYSSYMGKDTLWELSFWYTPGTTDGKIYLNVAINFDGKYITTKTTLKEETIEHITRSISIPSGVSVVYDGAVLTVGGEDTNTTAFNVVVEQGDMLPTGYTSDGKYILGWTADDSAVTTYDKAKTKYVAEFVDTKMLVVKQQNNGKSPKNVRFIGSLNTLQGYDEAGFVFANKPVSGDLTIANGRQVVLNTAYSALNAAGTSVTADKKYDAYSSYFIAYALKEIPAEVTIYARAYVKIGDTIIYGSMSTFDIDSLK